MPVIFLLLFGWMLVYLVIERPWPSVFGLLTMALGLLVHSLVAGKIPWREKEDVHS